MIPGVEINFLGPCSSLLTCIWYLEIVYLVLLSIYFKTIVLVPSLNFTL